MQLVLDFYQSLWSIGLREPSPVPLESPKELERELIQAEWTCMRSPSVSRARTQASCGAPADNASWRGSSEILKDVWRLAQGIGVWSPGIGVSSPVEQSSAQVSR